MSRKRKRPPSWNERTRHHGPAPAKPARRADEVYCPDCKVARRVRDDLRKLDEKARGIILGTLQANGNMVSAAQRAGVSFQAVYKLMETDAQFAAEVRAAREVPLDVAEIRLFENIRKGDERAIEFMLETRGKERGYIRRQEIDATVRNVEWTAQIGDDDVIRHEEKVH